MLSVMPKENGSFFTFHYTNSSLLPAPKVSRFDEALEVVCKKIDQRVDLKMVTLEDVFLFSDRLFCLFSDKLSSGVTLYLQEYDDEIDKIGPAIEVASYTFPKGLNRNVYTSIQISPNHNYLVIDYLVPGKKDDFDQFGYIILDKQLQRLRSGEFEIPFNSKFTVVEARHLTDFGDYFLGVSVFSKTNLSVWKNFQLVERSVVFHVSANDTLKMIDLGLDQQKVYNFSISSYENQVVITGTWGDEDSKGAKGIFSLHYDPQNRQTERIQFYEFEREFLETENSSADEIYAVQNTDSELLNYAFRKVSVLPNGDFIVVAEQYYIFEVSSTDSRGMSQVTNYYNYNDVLVYSFARDGSLNWLKKIPKKQESVNDFGQYSSLVCVLLKNELALFFNDHRQNYDDMGVYNGRRVSFTNSLRLKDYVFAKTTIDLGTGKTHRSLFAPYEAIDAFVCLKLSAVNYQSKQVIFTASRKKDRYGILRFN